MEAILGRIFYWKGQSFCVVSALEIRTSIVYLRSREKNNDSWIVDMGIQQRYNTWQNNAMVFLQALRFETLC